MDYSGQAVRQREERGRTRSGAAANDGHRSSRQAALAGGNGSGNALASIGRGASSACAGEAKGAHRFARFIGSGLQMFERMEKRGRLGKQQQECQKGCAGERHSRILSAPPMKWAHLHGESEGGASAFAGRSTVAAAAVFMAGNLSTGR
jgi:hypothetical protein